MNKLLLLVFTSLLTLLVIACTASSNSQAAQSTAVYIGNLYGSQAVYRVDDKEKGVSCYITSGYRETTISCVRL